MKPFIGGLAAILLAAGAPLAQPPRAAEAAAAAECAQPIDDVVALIEAAGGAFIDLIDVPGKDFDQLIVAEFGGAIAVGRALMGCAVGGPTSLGPAAARAEA